MRAVVRFVTGAVLGLCVVDAGVAQSPRSGTVGALVAVCTASEAECSQVFFDWEIFDALDYGGCLPDIASPSMALEMYDWLAARPELAGKDMFDGAHEAAVALWAQC